MIEICRVSKTFWTTKLNINSKYILYFRAVHVIIIIVIIIIIAYLEAIIIFKTVLSFVRQRQRFSGSWVEEPLKNVVTILWRNRIRKGQRNNTRLHCEKISYCMYTPFVQLYLPTRWNHLFTNCHTRCSEPAAQINNTFKTIWCVLLL